MIMKHLLLAALCVCCSLVANAQGAMSALMPMPNEITLNKDGKCFTVNEKTTISYKGDDLHFAAEELCKAIEEYMDVRPSIAKTGKGNITLMLDKSLTNPEHYTVDVSKSGIIIRGATPGAVLYGVYTLTQVMMGDVCMTAQDKVQGMYINDQPRFGYRAFMLDPARNFLPKEAVKFFIDHMAFYKYNVLQLHLTDDQGWRLYVEKYPQLASKDHYTKEDLQEIIRYAEQRNVTVIPEMDVPGHTSAILAAFPEFKCENKRDVEIKVGESVNMMLCASVDEIYTVMDDIIKEIAAIFPAEYIHLGGDEAAVAENWAKCPRCQELVKKLGYDKPSQLMIPFFDKVIGSVKKYGKRTILWCELDNIYYPANEYLFPYPKETVLVTWRNALTPKCHELTYKHGNPIIMAPGEYAYLDYPQYSGDFPEFNNWGMPITTLETCYKLDPGYGQPAEMQKHIMGVMATLWAEAIPDINRATYMAFPRGFAIVEAGWTQMENRSWDSFKERVFPNVMHLMKHGVSVRAPFEIAK